MKTLNELFSALYVAQACAHGPEALQTTNDVLATIASNRDTDPEAARMLRIMIAMSKDLYPKAMAAH